MKDKKNVLRCAVYTRKSHEDGLEQEYNSLDAQREAAENYIASQKMNGWRLLPDRYDDGGFSGGNMERPALKRLLLDVKAGKIDIILIYKMDRLSRSLLDFMKLTEMLEQHNVSFVSVTQDINTSTSSGRMMLNILMTFGQFERENIAERILDKIAGAKKRGKFCGGCPVLGYDSDPKLKKLVVNEEESWIVMRIFERYCQLGSARQVAIELNEQGRHTKSWTTRKGKFNEGGKFKPDTIYRILKNPLYIGMVQHKDKVYTGEQKAIVDNAIWKEAQMLLAGNLTANTRRKNEMANPFRGLVKCGHCGGAMGLTYTKKKDRRYVYYICQTDAKRAISECPLKSVPSGEMERLILKSLGQIFMKPALLSKTYSQVKAIDDSERNRLQKLRQKYIFEHEYLKKKIAEVIQSGEDGCTNKLHSFRTDFKEVAAKLAGVDDELKKIQSRPSSCEDIVQAFGSLDVLWGELFPVERYRLLRLLVEKITVSVDGIRMELKTAGMGTLVEELMNDNLVEAV